MIYSRFGARVISVKKSNKSTNDNYLVSYTVDYEDGQPPVQRIDEHISSLRADGGMREILNAIEQ